MQSGYQNVKYEEQSRLTKTKGYGLMDMASDYESGGCGFESR